MSNTITQTFATQNGTLIAQSIDGDALVQDISICIVNILTTIPGQDRTRANFGSRLIDCLDKPFKLARLCVISKLTDAINQWEKRVKVIRVAVSQASASELHISITWEMV
jgi:phage baseplate assembly protein W